MFRLHKLILTSLTVFMFAALTACTLGQTAEPTPTAVDLNAINTAAVATVQAQLTLTSAAIVPPTLTPIATVSEVPASIEATNTPGGAALEATLTLTPAETPLFGTTAIPSFTPIGGGGSIVSGGPTAQLCKNASFDGDITVPDGTVFGPWEKFTKAWSIRNTGTCKWDEGFYFAAVDGPPSMGRNQGPYKFRTTKDFIGPGESVIIYIDMYAPGDPGDYVAHWHMYDDNNQPFGGDFTVVIKVVK